MHHRSRAPTRRVRHESIIISPDPSIDQSINQSINHPCRFDSISRAHAHAAARTHLDRNASHRTRDVIIDVDTLIIIIIGSTTRLDLPRRRQSSVVVERVDVNRRAIAWVNATLHYAALTRDFIYPCMRHPRERRVCGTIYRFKLRNVLL